MVWMQTHSGLAFDLLDPDPRKVEIDHLTQCLARTPRFNGATVPAAPYNVAHHSYLAEQILPADASSPRTRLLTILHDAHEAYMGDITSPVKAALRAHHPRVGDALKELASKIDLAIFRAFGLHPWEWEEGEARVAWSAVRLADLTMLAAERRDLMAPCGREWDDMPSPDAVPLIEPLPANASGYVWRERVKMLVREAGCTPLPTLGLWG